MAELLPVEVAQLPVELLVERVLPLVSARTLLRARAVSREWREMVDALRHRGGLKLHYDSLHVVRVCIGGHCAAVKECAWAPDGSALVTVSTDGRVRVWIAANWSCLTPQPLSLMWTHPYEVTACAWAPDGSALVTASSDMTMRVWCTADWSCLRTLSTGHTCGVTACVWAPDGSTLVTTSEDRTARVWSAADCLLAWRTDWRTCDAMWRYLRTLITGHTRGVTACAWAPDGSALVTASSDMTMRVWCAADWSCLRTLTGHTRGVTACAWTPDGSAVVTTSWDKTARVWSAADWSCLHTLTAHTREVLRCAWAPDGSALITTSWDMTVRVWSAADWSCLRILTANTDWVTACAWAPDGSSIVTSSLDTTTVRVWSDM